MRCVKKRKVDLKGGLVKKRKEKWRLGKQVGDLQKKIHVLTQQLSAKELELDDLTQDFVFFVCVRVGACACVRACVKPFSY